MAANPDTSPEPQTLLTDDHLGMPDRTVTHTIPALQNLKNHVAVCALIFRFSSHQSVMQIHIKRNTGLVDTYDVVSLQDITEFVCHQPYAILNTRQIVRTRLLIKRINGPTEIVVNWQKVLKGFRLARLQKLNPLPLHTLSRIIEFSRSPQAGLGELLYLLFKFLDPLLLIQNQLSGILYGPFTITGLHCSGILLLCRFSTAGSLVDRF